MTEGRARCAYPGRRGTPETSAETFPPRGLDRSRARHGYRRGVRGGCRPAVGSEPRRGQHRARAGAPAALRGPGRERPRFRARRHRDPAHGQPRPPDPAQAARTRRDDLAPRRRAPARLVCLGARRRAPRAPHACRPRSRRSSTAGRRARSRGSASTCPSAPSTVGGKHVTTASATVELPTKTAAGAVNVAAAARTWEKLGAAGPRHLVPEERTDRSCSPTPRPARTSTR